MTKAGAEYDWEPEAAGTEIEAELGFALGLNLQSSFEGNACTL